jgi:trigger factor
LTAPQRLISVNPSSTQNPLATPAVNIQLADLSATRKSLIVTLDKNEVDAEHQAVVAEFVRQARLPGFRPGKAPVAMIAKRFAKDIADEFKQKVVAKAYKEAMDKQKLEVITIAKVEEGTIEPGLSAAITFTVDVQPTFQLPEYVGLHTEVLSTESTEQEVDRVIEGMRAERADFKVAVRAAQKGDYLKLAYEGAIEGKPILELVPDKQIYGKVPQTWEEVEGETEGVIPGLGKHLGGLKAGDKKDVTVKFPGDFAPVPVLAGRTAVYAVEVQEVRERVLPAIDAEFLKAQQADSLDTLKASVRTSLKMQKEAQNRSAQRRQITEALAGKVDFALPAALVEAETQNVLRQYIEENMRRGVPQEQFEKDKQRLFNGAQQAAAQRVKVQLLVSRIAEKEQIKVGERDIDAFIYREAMRTGQRPDKIVKDIAKDRGMLRSIQESIIFDKAVDFLVAKATVATVQPKT